VQFFAHTKEKAFYKHVGSMAVSSKKS